MQDGRILDVGALDPGRRDEIVDGQGLFKPSEVHLTRQHPEKLAALADEGFVIGPDNLGAVSRADCIVITVQPGQMDTVLEEISSGVDPERHGVITVATGVRLERLRSFLGEDVSLVRAMPNTADSARQ